MFNSICSIGNFSIVPAPKQTRCDGDADKNEGSAAEQFRFFPIRSPRRLPISRPRSERATLTAANVSAAIARLTR